MGSLGVASIFWTFILSCFGVFRIGNWKLFIYSSFDSCIAQSWQIKWIQIQSILSIQARIWSCTDNYFFAAGISVWANPKEDRGCFCLVLQIITAYQSQYYFRNGSINSQCSQLLSGVCGREHLPASNAQECKKLKFINRQERNYA